MDFENKEKDISWDEAEEKLKKAFDFSAFLGTEELDDKVTDVMDGKDLLEPDAFDRFAPDYVPRRGSDPERGRHEAPGQEPEPMEFVEEAPEEPAMDPTDPRYAAPERPRVMVAGAQRPTVYITPEGDFNGPDNYGGESPAVSSGEGKKWLVAVVIALGVVALVLGAVLALFGGGTAPDEPVRENDILLVTPAPTDEPEDEQEEPEATPVPTDEPEETPEPTEPPAELYTILVTAGNGGGIHPSGTVEVEEGESVTFTLYPDEGWDVSQLIIDGESVAPAGSYTFEKVKDDHTIYAVFVKLATPPPTDVPATPTPEPTPEPTSEPTPAPTEPPASLPEEPAVEDAAVVEDTAE